jgi:DNA-directed RNA polymerase alpha subunit
MLIKEFITETNKNQMISTLLKYYKVGNVKVKQKSMKDHAHFNVDTGTLELSTKYKKIKTTQIKDFLITIIHEIRHAMDAKKYGWRKFKDMYEMEIAQWQARNPGKEDDWYDYIPYEVEAENFGQKNWNKWKNRFKKEGLI